MSRHHILVVEDEAHLAAGLKLNLELEGFKVDVAGSVAEAGSLLVRDSPYSVILLDVMLPDMNGMDFCRHLRNSGNFTPVVMLTALATPEERVKGLEAGADDYLPKPFELKELMARMRAQLRRQTWSGQSQERVSPVLSFGDAEVNFKTHRAVFAGRPVSLTRLEIDLLRYFSDHRGRVLSRDELLKEVWGLTGDVRSRTVDNFVLRLRKLFEHDPAQPRYILSVRGAGYVFQAE